MQSFLLETSILDNLSGPLCDALTGRGGGQHTWRDWRGRTLLVVPLDDDRVWYRYHHLFADFLRGRLERERPEQGSPLHLRAAEWVQENALVAEAVRHALSAATTKGGTADGVGIGQTWYRGEVVTLLGWLRKLPKEPMLRRRCFGLVRAADVGCRWTASNPSCEKQRVWSAPGKVKARSRGRRGRGRPSAFAGNRRCCPILARSPPGDPQAPSIMPGEPRILPRTTEPSSLCCPRLAEAYRAADDLRRQTRPSPRQPNSAGPPATTTSP